jgi:hypothetical protein
MSTRFLSGLRTRYKVLAGLAVVAVAAGLTVIPGTDSANASVLSDRSNVKGSDGKDYWVENHLVSKDIDASRAALHGRRPEYLIVWAGDSNVADTVVPDVKNLPGSITGDKPGSLLGNLPGALGNTVDKVRNSLPGPDFMAVLDATKGSPTYGKVVNTATVGPLVENEPHHMQYVWHKGEKIYAGGLFSAVTYVFDVTKLPALSLSGISLPTSTLCGSVPDAYWVLKDGTAYGTYMGGPVAPGPCRYTHGEVRTGNGFAGTPGEVIRFGQHGEDLVQAPAATGRVEDPTQCDDLPNLGTPSCANPHGVQLREDLHTMVTSDYAEPRNIILDPIKAPSPFLRRSTIRTWDITDLNHPKVKSVSYLKPGPRAQKNDPLHWENRAIMETTVTNRPGHKGAFAQSMQGGAVYYAPDITAAHPAWREVFDDWAGDKKMIGGGTGSGDNAGWIQTSPDDKTVYHAIVGRQKGTLGPNDPGTAGGIIAIDVSKLVDAGTHAQCEIRTVKDAQDGGSDSDCPKVKSVVTINPNTPAGGPHWGALDNLKLGGDGYYHETDQPRRIASANYFVARTGLDGDHKVCMTDISKDGKLSLDTSFRDENTGQPCVSFNRKYWPHGAFGNAKPHSMLFVTSDDDIK